MSALESHVDHYLRLRRTLGYDLEETGRLLMGHPRCCLDRRRERAKTACPVQGPDADQPVPAVGEVPRAATGRSPG